ncbi:MAG: hypothetical protein GC208_06095 [Alphaproteobacteria bacterium]|nr:hypothetical protein [Alphaproteobacteria bacterium]
MFTPLKLGAAAIFVSLTAMAAAPAANAGTWHLDARACPDIREDYRDARRWDGRGDRREDIRDARQINCPARAWTYQPDRYERSYHRAGYATPGVVYRARFGGYFAVDRYGQRIPIRVVIHNEPRYAHRPGYRDRYDRYRDRHGRHDRRGRHGYRGW